MKTEYIQSNGVKIHTISHIISEEFPTILWVHGFAEHSLRYQEIMHFLGEKGFNSVGFDLRGHGKSEGVRGYIQDFNEYLQDLEQVRNYYEQKYPKTRWFLVGHSMGGLIVIRYHQTRYEKTRWQLKVVSSPLLGIAAKVPAWKKLLSKWVVSIYPKLSVPSGLNPQHLSHDPKVVEAYQKDPLVLKNATAGWFEATLLAMQAAFQEVHKVQEGLSFLVAGEDKLVSVEATQNFFQRIPPNAGSTLKVYPQMYHEIFNEVGKEMVWNDLLALLNQYT